MTQTIRQTLDPGTGADDLLPNYTPDADPADCRADNLLDSYEKVWCDFLKVSLTFWFKVPCLTSVKILHS